MAAPFSRTLGAVRSDRGRSAAVVGGLGFLLLATWASWLFEGRIAVFRTSTKARIEVTPAPAQVAAPTAGRIVEVHLVVGARVAAGDPLVTLDTASERIALDRARVRLGATEPELASMARQLAAETQAGSRGATADAESERMVIAQRRSLEVALTQAEEEEKRTRAMVAAGVQPSADLSHAVAETKLRRAALDAQLHEVGARTADRRQRESTREVGREQLERQRAELEASIATTRGEIDQLVHEIDRHTVRAPVAGVLGDVAVLRPGAVLAEGAVIATVVPDGTLQAVAEYGPAAIGRIAPGQRAHVRLDGFPWTHYGTLEARVVRVGSELREGLIRVELSLAPHTTIPVAHGMTGTIDIEVEQASPVELLVRALGEGSGS
jgi:membrane fusion protein (multidrug efflux system)